MGPSTPSSALHQIDPTGRPTNGDDKINKKKECLFAPYNCGAAKVDQVEIYLSTGCGTHFVQDQTLFS